MKSFTPVISVNPAKPSAGEKYAKAVAAIEDGVRRVNAPFRFPVIDSLEGPLGTLHRTLGLVLGVTGPKTGLTAPIDSVTLVARAGFGLFLFGCGILTAGSFSSNIIMALGIMLMSGLLTRVSMIGYGVAESFLVWQMWQTGVFSYGHTILAVIALVIALIGPGHISIDGMLSHSIMTGARRRSELRLRARRCSYQAYHDYM